MTTEFKVSVNYEFSKIRGESGIFSGSAKTPLEELEEIKADIRALKKDRMQDRRDIERHRESIEDHRKDIDHLEQASIRLKAMRRGEFRGA